MPPPLPSPAARWPAATRDGPGIEELWKRWRADKEEQGELTRVAKEVAAAAIEMVAGEWRTPDSAGGTR